MGRIADRFAQLRGRGERALIPFLTAGDPNLPTTEALVLAMAEAGADLIEVGVPFSDPSAEGPTIQRSSERALRSGTTLRGVLKLIQNLRPKVEQPLVLMGYANVFLAMGERNFAAAAKEVGVDGVITVDLPPEEGQLFFDSLIESGIDPILLASPTTPESRMEMLVERARGFLYYVSLTGVTGARKEMAAGLEEAVSKIREISGIPVCVGFGISTPEQVAEVGRFADGAVVWSALVDLIEAAETPGPAVISVSEFVAKLKGALR
ncbi:MAG: tryptophan synthase subunit alpha [Deltaproteobacteria bacterium]|jgi:tryptophan synthase alpha chain|nr:tryptophan synthase subunit alpha [Deltaproteobacteria bacterium]